MKGGGGVWKQEEMDAHGCQANGIGVGGLGDGFSQEEGHMVVAWTYLKSLLFLNSPMNSVMFVE